jgi:hypothetical protein
MRLRLLLTGLRHDPDPAGPRPAQPQGVPAARRAASGAAVLARREMLMSAGKMHSDEVETDASLVGRLLAAQFSWATR